MPQQVVQEQPYFFGSPERRLYGCYHPPALQPQGTRRGSGIVMCYPTGPEYIRAHRAFRQFALRLSRLGYPAFRFDYSGSGDSTGEATDGLVSHWIEDIGTAADELKRRCGVSSLCLLGLRLGATLALEAASQRDDVTTAVAWEPLTRGSDYLDQLAELNRKPRWGVDEADTKERPDGSVELLGLPFSRALRDELAGLALASPRGVAQVLLITHPAESPGAGALVDTLCGDGGDGGDKTRVTHEQIEATPVWKDDEQALVPLDVLKAVTAWFTAEVP